MKMQLSNFNEGKHLLDFKANASEIGLTDPFFGDVNCSIEIDKIGNDAKLKIKSDCVGRFFCDRCLIEFEKKIEVNFRLNISLDGIESEKKDDLNFYKIESWNHTLDLSKDICDYFELEIPTKLLCNDNCFGLCYQCGANLNDLPSNKCSCENQESDPRWDELKKVL